VSPDARRPGSNAGGWPPAISDAGPASNVSLVVGRGLGTVVVTVEGELDLAGCQLLENVLTDLIEGQGNLTVAVDLSKAIVEPEALMVFIDAARQARRLGSRFVLKEPPTHTHEALQSGGFDDLVEVLPRRASGG
jgi:anti-anti-sigma factor